MCKVTTVIFDKTGTLTMGRPTVTNIVLDRTVLTDLKSKYRTEDDILRLAGAVEANSEHPLGV